MTRPLPNIYDSFSEVRKNDFLKAKAIKDQDGIIAGVFCAFTPEEILDAAGIYSVNLCGTSEETIGAAESTLPKNLCPLIKSSYGFALTDKCPYTYFADIIIGETTCDGKKKMYELLSEIKDTYIMQLPQGIDRAYAKKMWESELWRLIRRLEQSFGMSITEKQLREASRVKNDVRQAKLDLMDLQKLNPPPIYGKELYNFLEGLRFNFCSDDTPTIRNIINQIMCGYQKGERPVSIDAKRVLVTGCPIGGVFKKTIGAIEDNGGVVVCFENCGGIKSAIEKVDTEAENIVAAIASRYLNIGCSVMTPNYRRMELLAKLIVEFQVEGIVDIVLQTCHPYSVEGYSIKKMAKDLGICYISIETDYSESDIGQLTTRLAAFIEMI